MKRVKILRSLIVSLFISYIFQAQLAEAAVTCGPALGIYCNTTSNKDFISVVIKMIKYLFSIIGIFFLVFMILAGIKYMTSAGSEQRVTSAKESFSSSIFGLIIALLAYGILDIIHNILNS